MKALPLSLRERLAHPQAWIALFSIFAVALIAVVDTERTSPGPISGVHATVAELAGGTDCASCHGGLFGDMAESCLECHAPIAEQIGEQRGLHGTNRSADRTRCALCHSEHHGLGFSPVNAGSFALAGIAKREEFRHERVGFEMGGAHLPLDCAECHANADLGVLAAGQVRFLGLDRDCASCHEDPHEGRMRRSCEECHSEEEFEVPAAREHARFLELVGPHAGLDCRSCHAAEQDHSLETLAHGVGSPQPRQCGDCHDSPHGAPFLSGVARKLRVPENRACASCHVAEHMDFRGAIETHPAQDASELPAAQTRRPPELTSLVTPELHAASDFPLEAPHGDLACAACHPRNQDSFAARYPGRKQESCSVCHGGPHEEQFDRGRFAGRECTACHAREDFELETFDLEAHRRTAFPLEASHAALDCAACHLDPAQGKPRRFHGTPKRCDACHPDAHDDTFEDALEESGESLRTGTCAVCHLQSTFDDLPSAADAPESALPLPFEHGRWTGFPLGGAHLQEKCESCHAPKPLRDATGRRFGRVEDQFGRVQGCASCHGDPHRGRFDDTRLPTRRSGPGECLRCHSQTSFRALPERFDHGFWTGFRLDGAHASADCSVCHAPMRRPDTLGRTWGAAKGSGCEDCHGDNHGGQFRGSDSATDCARCHRSAVGWDVLRFDHDRQSRFPLRESHEKVSCSACHTRQKLESGGSIVRYRPLETGCATCHNAQRVRRNGSTRGKGRDKN